MAQAKAPIRSAIAEVCNMTPASSRDALDQSAAITLGSKGRGTALADMLCTELQAQAGKMKMYVQSLADLDVDGRKGFTDFIGEVLKERKLLVKENGTKFYKDIAASAGVRLSEFRTIAKAMDKGFQADLTQGYHVIVAAARELLRAAGEGDKRGRKATHGIVKAMKYLAKLESLDDSDKAAIETLLAQAEAICKGMGLAADVGEGDAPF